MVLAWYQWHCVCPDSLQLKVEIPRQPRNIFGPLLRRVQTVNPIQYQLPVEIRTNFRGGESSCPVHCFSCALSYWDIRCLIQLTWLEFLVATSETGAFINTELTRPLKIEYVKTLASDMHPSCSCERRGSPSDYSVGLFTLQSSPPSFQPQGLCRGPRPIYP